MHCPSATNVLTQVCMSTIGSIDNVSTESKLSRRSPQESNEEGRNKIDKKTKIKIKIKKQGTVIGKPQPVFVKLFRLPSIGTND